VRLPKKERTECFLTLALRTGEERGTRLAMVRWTLESRKNFRSLSKVSLRGLSERVFTDAWEGGEAGIRGRWTQLPYSPSLPLTLYIIQTP
jgi:hypothetical protein